MLGQLGLVTSETMLSQWRYVVVGATVVAAVLTPSTDPFTQVCMLCALLPSVVRNQIDKLRRPTIQVFPSCFVSHRMLV